MAKKCKTNAIIKRINWAFMRVNRIRVAKNVAQYANVESPAMKISIYFDAEKKRITNNRKKTQLKTFFLTYPHLFTTVKFTLWKCFNKEWEQSNLSLHHSWTPKQFFKKDYNFTNFTWSNKNTKITAPPCTIIIIASKI